MTVVRLATSPLRFVGTWLYMRNLRRWLATHEVDPLGDDAERSIERVIASHAAAMRA